MPTKKKRAGQSIYRVEEKLDLFKEHFDSHMMNVNKKIDNVEDRFGKVEITLVKQQSILDEHVRRTNILEDKVDSEKKILQDSLEPIKAQGAQMSILIKILAGILGAGGAGFGIKEILSLISG